MVVTDQCDEDDDDEILANPFCYYDEYNQEPDESFNLHNADEIYPSDLDIFAD